MRPFQLLGLLATLVLLTLIQVVVAVPITPKDGLATNPIVARQHAYVLVCDDSRLHAAYCSNAPCNYFCNSDGVVEIESYGPDYSRSSFCDGKPAPASHQAE
jgi:hypothetical protein